MVANHAMGLEHTARRAFERCRDTLADQFGIYPTSDTEDVAGTLEAGVPARGLIESLVDERSRPATARIGLVAMTS